MTKHHCYVFKKITDYEDPSNDELKLMCSLRGTESEAKQLVELLNKMNCSDFVKYEVDLEVQDGEDIYDQL